MKKMFSFILLAFICICGYAQTIAPALLEEMGRHRDNEKIRVFVIMRQQYDQQHLNLRADQFTTRAERREFVVNELKQFAEASQYDLRRSLSEMQRADLVTEPKVLWIANAISFEATRGAILSLADRSDIMVIDFDKEHYCIPDGEASQPADLTREITSNVTQVNADQVWNLGYTGQGVVVAIIDTGVNYNHLDLADHLWDGGAEFPNHGYDVYDNDNDPMDEHVKYDQYGNIVSHGHGTHCAGTLCGDGTAGSQTGIAPDATLMCLKISDTTGTSNPTIEVDAMQWAVDHGCDIISMSFGGHGHSPATQTLFRNTCVNVLNAGVIAAIAAGNEGNKLSQYPIPDNVALPGGCPPPYLDPDQQQNPGGLSCSVCVGAVDSNDVAADFTSHGPRDWSESDYADYPYTSGSQSEFGLIRPDVCAPGVDIISTDSWNTSGYQTKDGTSMATPCVAGCMALLLSKNPDATPAELCRILEETAVPLSTGKSNIYGYGRVDALAAINAFAYDFSAVCSTGQRLYYNIIHPVDPYVEITCPGTSSTNPWSGYTQPTGNIILPSYVSYGGVIYTVKRIADNAFRDCSGLTGSLTIPNSVTSIGANAFQGCSGFTGSLTIGNSVTTIHNSAFYGCNGFTGSLTIGNSVTTIGNSAFRNCSGFTGSLTIPNSVTLIGEYAFALNSGFTGSLTIPNSVTTIYNGAFHGCNGFTGSLTIGNSVTAIHNYAFYGCSGFTGSLTIGNSVTSIGQAAFYNCTGFTSMTARPETPPTLGTNAFQNVPTGIPVGVPCGSLLDYQDASGWYEFYNMHRIDNDCDLLTYSINDDGVSVTVTGHVDGIIATGSLTIPETTTIDGVTYAVTAIGVEAFRNYTQLTGSLTIPNSVTTIGNNAFRGCTGFTGSLTIPNSVTTIDNDAFRGCTGFNGSLTLPSSLTSLGAFAFYSCSGFTGSLTIPNSLTSVGTCAFCYCTGFTGSLTIPNAVTFLEDWAFGNCTGLTSMTVLPETPPSLGTSVFSNVPTGIPVYVPCGSLWDYRDASGWSVFSNIQCLLETLTVYDGTVTNNRIPAYIFYFDGFTRSQFVIPAADLVEMKDKPISRMTFYTTNSNVPYVTDCSVDVYLKTVNYTSISSYETKASCTTVYSGFLNIISTNSGGEMTIYFDSPYTYNGGNLLVGFENTEDNTYQNIHFYGQTVSGASISGASASSTGTIPATQQNFIPKTSFGYLPTCETKSLPYAFGFEEDGEEYCWTMLNCYSTTGVYNSTDAYEGDYCFRFHYTVDPPQYLISPKFEGTIGMNVSFYYKNGSSSWPETFQVGYSTTTQTPNAFIWGEEVTVNSPNDWLLYEDSFPEGTKYVAVKCTSYDQLYLYLDNFSFEPAYCAPEDQCELTFTLTDSYGDGWNGNAIRVVDVETGIVLATMTNQDLDGINGEETQTVTLAVCDGRELRFEWVSGSWPSECSYTVTDSNGNEIFSGEDAMSAPVTYTVNCSGVVQTIELTEGWNWVSLYVELGDPAEALQMLEAALGDNAVSINASEMYTEYFGSGFWIGDLDDVGITNEQMYMVEVVNDCEIELEGAVVNPADYEITIYPGWNWIGFPSSEELNLEDAFADFEAEDGDQLTEAELYTEYGFGMWIGDVAMLVPGRGYMYYSNSTQPKTLVFPSTSKGKNVFLRKRK